MWLMLSVMGTGGALFGFLWVVAKPAANVSASLHKPHEQWRAVRWLWPWVHAVAPLCEPFVPWTVRERLGRHLQWTGLAGQLTVSELVAIQLVAGVAVGIITFLAAIFMLDNAYGSAAVWAFALAVPAAWWPRHALRQRAMQRQHSMLRDMPFMLDMTTLCVEAGLNLQGALHQAARYSPDGPLNTELHRALADIRAGKARLQALQDMAERTHLPAMASLVAALAQADQLGVSLGPLLRAQSDQRRSERFLRAEEQALKAPVKMLFPLVLCIFPCTFLIIGFPVMQHLLDGLA